MQEKNRSLINAYEALEESFWKQKDILDKQTERITKKREKCAILKRQLEDVKALGVKAIEDVNKSWRCKSEFER